MSQLKDLYHKRILIQTIACGHAYVVDFKISKIDSKYVSMHHFFSMIQYFSYNVGKEIMFYHHLRFLTLLKLIFIICNIKIAFFHFPPVLSGKKV